MTKESGIYGRRLKAAASAVSLNHCAAIDRVRNSVWSWRSKVNHPLHKDGSPNITDLKENSHELIEGDRQDAALRSFRAFL